MLIVKRCARLGVLLAGFLYWDPFVINLARAENDPVYVVQDGRVDKHTFNGYRRYGESCLRCHGPDGAGSSYAPALIESLKHMNYDDFATTVIQGRKNVTQSQNNVMPSFGLVEDVALYLDDIYGYLKARSDGKLPRGRPKRIGEDD
jgi:methanol metabolism-related c-type cytochrome